MKKLLILFLFFTSIIGNAQDLKNIRTLYPEAVKGSEAIAKLELGLKNINSSSKPVLLTYKGGVLTLKAKFAKKKSDKKDFFKEGVSLIESAIKAEPSNIEIRYIRMSVQENSPRFLGYHKNIDEDKQYILDNYAAIVSMEIKKVIKDFILKSENFNDSEKSLFN